MGKTSPIEEGKKTQKESDTSSWSVAGFVGYLGFGGQIASSMILIHLPMLEAAVGGKLFSFCLGIATGISGNVVRLGVLIYGRKFTFSRRVIVGSILSAIFTFGFFVVYQVSESDDSNEWGFWVGLCIALLGGMGNAQLLSTGYGIASILSERSPISNSLFFLGMAAASALCWPIKRIFLELNPQNPYLHLGILMGLTALISLSLIPLFYIGLRKETTRHSIDKRRITCLDVCRIFKQTILPNVLLWTTLTCTAIVTPGQVMLWSLPTNCHTSDLKLYLSLCIYLGPLSDAFGKLVCVILASRKPSFEGLLKSQWTPRLLISMTLVRIGLMPLVYNPPTDEGTRFFILIFFGFLHGIIASISLSLSSFRVSRGDADLAGYLGSFSIVNGLLIGSLIGMVIRLSLTAV